MATSGESDPGTAPAGEGKNPRPITVLVVDHNPILLQGIAALIRSQPDLELVGATCGAAAAIALHREALPDIIVIDLELPAAESQAVIRRILSAEPKAKLIGLTTCGFDRFGNEALPAGVMAVLAKDRLEPTLVPLIRHQVRPGA